MQVALPVLSTLEALHQQGLVHRDLKPSNIFLTAHGVLSPCWRCARRFRAA